MAPCPEKYTPAHNIIIKHTKTSSARTFSALSQVYARSLKTELLCLLMKQKYAYVACTHCTLQTSVHDNYDAEVSQSFDDFKTLNRVHPSPISFSTEGQGNSSMTENRTNVANRSIQLRRQTHFTHQILSCFHFSW